MWRTANKEKKFRAHKYPHSIYVDVRYGGEVVSARIYGHAGHDVEGNAKYYLNIPGDSLVFRVYDESDIIGKS